MKINKLKSHSSPVVVLNYLGMRKRAHSDWVASKDIMESFPRRFKNSKKRVAYFGATMRKLIRGNYVLKKTMDDLDYYSITKSGSELPYRVAALNKMNVNEETDNFDE